MYSYKRKIVNNKYNLAIYTRVKLGYYNNDSYNGAIKLAVESIELYLQCYDLFTGTLSSPTNINFLFNSIPEFKVKLNVLGVDNTITITEGFGSANPGTTKTTSYANISAAINDKDNLVNNFTILFNDTTYNNAFLHLNNGVSICNLMIVDIIQGSDIDGTCSCDGNDCSCEGYCQGKSTCDSNCLPDCKCNFIQDCGFDGNICPQFVCTNDCPADCASDGRIATSTCGDGMCILCPSKNSGTTCPVKQSCALL